MNPVCVSIAYPVNNAVQSRTNACAIRVMFAMQMAIASKKICVVTYHVQLVSIGTIVVMNVRSSTVPGMTLHVPKYVKLVASVMKAIIVMQVASASHVRERKRVDPIHIGTSVEAHVHQSVANRMLNFVRRNVFRNANATTASFLMPLTIVSRVKTVQLIIARMVSTGQHVGAVARRRNAVKITTCALRSVKNDANVMMVWYVMRVLARVFPHQSAVLNNVVIMKSGTRV